MMDVRLWIKMLIPVYLDHYPIGGYLECSTVNFRFFPRSQGIYLVILGKQIRFLDITR